MANQPRDDQCCLMVRINRVYTRAGDDGSTALATGQRVPKDGPRVEAYGTVDELNSVIGVALSHGVVEALVEPLGITQQILFNLGSDLAMPPVDGQPRGPAVTADHVTQLETWMDTWGDSLEPLTSFVLPGGTLSAAELHVARTVCRRAERLTIALSRSEAIGEQSIPYLNRLSDALFVAARYENKLSGNTDVLWDSRKF